MNFTKINPVGARVVVKPYEAATTSTSGLIIAHTNGNTAGGKVLGTILEVGDLSQFKDQVGKMIFYRRYSIDELKYIDGNGEQIVYLVEDDEILALPEMKE